MAIFWGEILGRGLRFQLAEQVLLDGCKRGGPPDLAGRQRVIGLCRRGVITEAEAEAELVTLQKELAAVERQRDALLARQHERLDVATQLTPARILLEQLRARVAEASWDARRQLVEALVEWVRVDTLEEGGRKTTRITIRYGFDRELTDCSTSRLRDDSMELPQSTSPRRGAR